MSMDQHNCAKPAAYLALNVAVVGIGLMGALVGGAGAASAGPCTAQIAQFEEKIRQARATLPPGGAGEPSLPQSVGAQLHHQPTVRSVESAESQANVDAAAALDRARKADAAGDASACAKALQDAKELYGIF